MKFNTRDLNLAFITSVFINKDSTISSKELIFYYASKKLNGSLCRNAIFYMFVQAMHLIE